MKKDTKNTKTTKKKEVKETVKKKEVKVNKEKPVELDGKMTTYLLNTKTDNLERKTQAQLNKLVGLESEEWEILRKNIKKGKKYGDTQFNIYKNDKKRVFIIYGINLNEGQANAIYTGMKARAEKKKNGTLDKGGIKTLYGEIEAKTRALKENTLHKLVDIYNNYDGNIEEAEDELNRELDDVFKPQYIAIDKKNRTEEEAEKEAENLIEKFKEQVYGKKKVSKKTVGNGEKTFHCRAMGINWDVDNDEDLEQLPSNATIDIEDENENEVREVIADKLTDEYGFCINSIDNVIIVEKGKKGKPVDTDTIAYKVGKTLDRYVNKDFTKPTGALVKGESIDKILYLDIKKAVYNFVSDLVPSNQQGQYIVKGNAKEICKWLVQFSDKSGIGFKLIYHKAQGMLCIKEYNVGTGWKELKDHEYENMKKVINKEPQIIKYKGYDIDCFKTYKDKITVQINGDDLVFESIEEAQREIDKDIRDKERIEDIKKWQDGTECKEGYKRFQLTLYTNDKSIDWEELERVENFARFFKGKGRYYGLIVCDYVLSDGYVTVMGYIENDNDLRSERLDLLRYNIYKAEVDFIEPKQKDAITQFEEAKAKVMDNLKNFDKEVNRRYNEAVKKYSKTDLIYAEDIGYDEVGSAVTSMLEDAGYNVTYDD